jgi:hypothetical protein
MSYLFFSVALAAALALAFERKDPAAITEEEARRWTRRSLGRFPLDFITCGAMLAAFAAAAC